MITQAAISTLPDSVQLASSNAHAIKVFKSMSDVDLLRYTAKCDRKMADLYARVGAKDMASGLVARAEAFERVVKVLNNE